MQAADKPRSFFNVYARAVGDDVHLQLGYALAILCGARTALNRQLRFVDHTLMPAITHRQIRFLFDEDGEPAAYVIWATLTPEVERRAARNSRLGLHFSEWNEGENLWIVDIAARPGYLKYVLRYCRDVLFGDRQQVRYLRLGRAQVTIRTLLRATLSGCLRAMPPADNPCRCGRMLCLLDAAAVVPPDSACLPADEQP